jgi:hypothetical protein
MLPSAFHQEQKRQPTGRYRSGRHRPKKLFIQGRSAQIPINTPTQQLGVHISALAQLRRVSKNIPSRDTDSKNTLRYSLAPLKDSRKCPLRGPGPPEDVTSNENVLISGSSLRILRPILSCTASVRRRVSQLGRNRSMSTTPLWVRLSPHPGARPVFFTKKTTPSAPGQHNRPRDQHGRFRKGLWQRWSRPVDLISCDGRVTCADDTLCGWRCSHWPIMERHRSLHVELFRSNRRRDDDEEEETTASQFHNSTSANKQASQERPWPLQRAILPSPYGSRLQSLIDKPSRQNCTVKKYIRFREDVAP